MPVRPGKEDRGIGSYGPCPPERILPLRKSPGGEENRIVPGKGGLVTLSPRDEMNLVAGHLCPRLFRDRFEKVNGEALQGTVLRIVVRGELFGIEGQAFNSGGSRNRRDGRWLF